MTKPTDRAQTHTTMIPLNMLRHGHDPLAGPDLNARTSGRLERIDEMEAMLRSQGQLYPLLVIENPTGGTAARGLHFVFGGNRRLAALQRIHKGDDDTQVTIPCRVFPAGTPTHELSLAENNALPLHPVERFRGFAELIRRENISPAQQTAEIARRFGLTNVEANRALALGALDDSVLDAWLARKITAEAAQVFTLTDKASQKRILADAIKGQDWRRSPDQLRERIVGRKEDVWPAVKFVSVEAYQRAGGQLTEDLFEEKHVVHQPALAMKLATAKLDATCKTLIDNGWLWAAREDQMGGSNWRHGMGGFQKLPVPKTPALTDAERARKAELVAAQERAERGDDWEEQQRADGALEDFEATIRVRAYPPAQKKRAGCVLEISDDGDLIVHAGIVRPDEAKQAKKAAEAKKQPAGKVEKKETAISAALASRLSVALTQSAAEAVKSASDELVLRMAVAALDAGSTVVCLSHSGMGSHDMDGDEDFAAAFKKLERVKLDDLITKLGVFVAASVQMSNANPKRRPADPGEEDDVAALTGALPPRELQAELLKRVDLEDYFESAPGAMALEALAEMGVAAPKGTTKKAALAAFALGHARRLHWLPPQVRTTSYAGPGPVLPKKATVKSTGKKPAKKKRG